MYATFKSCDTSTICGGLAVPMSTIHQPIGDMSQTKLIDDMTDLEFVDHWIDNSAFISPILFRELRDRGLYHITNYLSGNRDEQRAIARARMAKAGHYVGEPEIEEIAGHIDQIKKLQAEIYNAESTDILQLLEATKKLNYHAEFVRNYFKEVKIP